MIPFELDDASRSTAADLSPAMLAFVERMAARPADARRIPHDRLDLPDWVTSYTYPLQSWPTFLGTHKTRMIERATVGVSDLVKAIPERIFERDVERIDRFYRFGNPLLTALMLEPPNGIESSVARLDFLDDAERGFRCLEANMGAFIGGWQVRFWERMYREDPVIGAFLNEHGFDARFEDPLLALLAHVVDDSVAQGVASSGALHLALVVDPELAPEHRPEEYVSELFRETLTSRAPGLDGRVVFATYPDDLTNRRGRLFAGDLQIHAVLEYTEQRTPQAVYRAFKAGETTLYNGPLDDILGDKRNLALLSVHGDSERFTNEERKIIREHVPWTRVVEAGTTTAPDGERIDLAKHVIARREHLLIKAASGAGGEAVHPGATTSQEEWREVVERGLAEPGRWIVQELLASRPYLYQTGEIGAAVHDVVWGAFCFGRSWGGAFLRMVPRASGTRVINSARGATRGFLFAVDDQKDQS